LEKKEKAAADAEAKKKLHEKIAANPFAFLVDDSEEEEVMPSTHPFSSIDNGMQRVYVDAFQCG